jgi:DNA-binding CsgD family transcriptional regulator
VSEDIVDRIYEAAFVPDNWPEVLGDIGALSGSASAAVLVFDGPQPPRFRATELTRPLLHEFCSTDAWKKNVRAPDQYLWPQSGFHRDTDLMTADQITNDSVHQILKRQGLGFQVATVIPMPRGEMVAFTFERRLKEGGHDPSAVSGLNGLRPHLARAGLLAARLGLEQARTTVATLAAIGLPAAVLSGSGRVMATNALLEAMTSIFVPTARGGMAIADIAANGLLQQAIASYDRRDPSVRSLPVPATEDRGPVVIHLLPVRGAAQDVFFGAEILVVAAAVDAANMVPTASLLHGLFDLSPAEARLAAGLSAGRTLQAAAEDGQIRLSTARSYLEAIFRKTGTHQQSQLVALLKSTQPMVRAE